MSGKNEGYSQKMDGTDDKKHGKGTNSHISDSYSDSSLGGPSCPRVYEEIIQQLEADIRKHIRIEH